MGVCLVVLDRSKDDTQTFDGSVHEATDAQIGTTVDQITTGDCARDTCDERENAHYATTH